MKMCLPHWEALRQGVKDRGMWPLVASSGKEAVDMISKQLRGEETGFDPLMSANWAISGRALEMGGLYLMAQKEDGSEYCPLCEADVHGGHAQEWITGCLDAQLEHARELNLVPKVQ